MEYGLALLLILAVVAYVVVRPLVRGERDEADHGALDALEAAKEAKYREIRDARLDLEMGKLSEADHKALERRAPRRGDRDPRRHRRDEGQLISS